MTGSNVGISFRLHAFFLNTIVNYFLEHSFLFTRFLNLHSHSFQSSLSLTNIATCVLLLCFFRSLFLSLLLLTQAFDSVFLSLVLFLQLPFFFPHLVFQLPSFFLLPRLFSFQNLIILPFLFLFMGQVSTGRRRWWLCGLFTGWHARSL